MLENYWLTLTTIMLETLMIGRAHLEQAYRCEVPFLKDLAKEEVVTLVHCGTNDQVVDILTKPLKLEVFLKLREKLGVCEVPNLN
ncbi:hypothetical protein CK203_019366 [Vitis vinifera]|uniref:Uncharacterized protein n=1 Tax=Vitis vinifera TaxID=29760 RepID=A0A438IYU8_VITVI|nr:hypothetical protein CK203_019366 [Vitis vinifera]